MDKLDRLGWAAGLAFTVYGLRIGIRVNIAEALHEIMDALPPGWQPAPSPVVDQLYSVIVGKVGSSPTIRRYHLLFNGPTRLVRSPSLADVFEHLEADIRLFVAEEAHERLFVHAGVVGWGGQAIVLPGGSGTGKSTLVAALVQAGATYYSDEYAVFDSHGYVHPYPRPLNLRGEAQGRSRRVPVEELGGARGQRPLPVGLVIVTEHQANAHWRPRPLSPGQVALALLSNTVSVRRQPAVTLATLQQVVSHAVALKSVRGEAETIATVLLRTISPAHSSGQAAHA